jgi:uncharacterized protein YdaU (DUF1376 family)
MGKNPAFQWYPNDYLRDTRILSLSSRGAWADMLNYMWYSEERGLLTGTHEQFARMLSCSIPEIENVLNELNVTQVADVTNSNGVVTVINRRMHREEKERKSTRLRVQKFRNGKCNTDSNANITPPSSTSSSSTKKETIKKEKISLVENCFVNIPNALILKWREVSPGININDEIKKAELWLLSNPEKRRSRYESFLSKWMVKAQNNFIKYGGNGNGNKITQPQKSPYIECPRCKAEVLEGQFVEIDGQKYCEKCERPKIEAKKAFDKLSGMIGKIGKAMPEAAHG